MIQHHSERTKPSLRGDHCPTATSMNKAVPTTHCGIGIVSEMIKGGLGGGGGQNTLGAGSHLMPWQLCVPLRTKPQALSFLLPLHWQRVNRRDNCSQGIWSTCLLEEVEQRSATKQEAGSIWQNVTLVNSDAAIKTWRGRKEPIDPILSWCLHPDVKI